MNARASQLGLDNSHYVNPNGYDADGHYTSAADLLALTLELLKYPLFDEIVQTDEATVAGHLLQNTNEFLGYYPGVTGIKTGTTTLAGQCLVTRIEQDGRHCLLWCWAARTDMLMSPHYTSSILQIIGGFMQD